MTGIEYLTDQDRETMIAEMVAAPEDHCLARAMDEGRQTPLLSRAQALAFLAED